MVFREFNLSIQEARAGGTLGLRPAWSTELVSEESGLHRETCLKKQTYKKQKKNQKTRKWRKKMNLLRKNQLCKLEACYFNFSFSKIKTWIFVFMEYHFTWWNYKINLFIKKISGFGWHLHSWFESSKSHELRNIPEQKICIGYEIGPWSYWN